MFQLVLFMVLEEGDQLLVVKECIPNQLAIGRKPKYISLGFPGASRLDQPAL